MRVLEVVVVVFGRRHSAGGETGHKTVPISRLILVALDRRNIPIIHGLNTKEPIKINFGHYFPFQLKISKTRQF